MKEVISFEVASLVSVTPPSGRHQGWGTSDDGEYVPSALRYVALM